MASNSQVTEPRKRSVVPKDAVAPAGYQERNDHWCCTGEVEVVAPCSSGPTDAGPGRRVIHPAVPIPANVESLSPCASCARVRHFSFRPILPAAQSKKRPRRLRIDFNFEPRGECCFARARREFPHWQATLACDQTSARKEGAVGRVSNGSGRRADFDFEKCLAERHDDAVGEFLRHALLCWANTEQDEHQQQERNSLTQASPVWVNLSKAHDRGQWVSTTAR